MKKRVLLTIMILFSIKVNTGDGSECKLPTIEFFEMKESDGIKKFDFQCFFADQDLSDLETTSKNVEYLGVKFNKKQAIGARLKVQRLFFQKIIEMAEKATIPLVNVISEGENEASFDHYLSEYDSIITPKDNDNLEKKILGSSGIKGIVDYFVDEDTKKLAWWDWWGKKVGYLKPVNSTALNASLNYIYLFALSFLVKDEQDTSKFLSCMKIAEGPLHIILNDAGVNNTVLKIFENIQIESRMAEKVKPTPLTLEQSRASLNMLSSTLTSLANLKFT